MIGVLKGCHPLKELIKLIKLIEGVNDMHFFN